MGAFISGLVQGGASTALKKKQAASAGEGGARQGQSLGRKLYNKIAGKSTPKPPSGLARPASDPGYNPVPAYKKGGKVRKTGLAKVHKGERVLTAKQARRYKKRAGGRRSGGGRY